MLRSSLRAAAATAALLAAPHQAGATNIGAVSAVNEDVDGTPPAAATRDLKLGDGLFSNERIQSSPLGSGQFLFLDQTSLTIAPNSNLTLDKYVYDPDTQTGEFTINMTRGVLRFVGGRITKSNDAVIVTPTATIGIRGGMAVVTVAEDGSTTVMHIAGDYTRVTANELEELEIIVPEEGGGGGSGNRRRGRERITISRPNGVASVGVRGLVFEGVAARDLVRETTLALIGRGEATARRRPENPDVASSGVPGRNSAALGAPQRDPISTSGERTPPSASDEQPPIPRDDDDLTPPVAPGGGGGGSPTPGVLIPGVTGAASFAAADAPAGLTAGASGGAFVFTGVFEPPRIGQTAAEDEFVIPVSPGFFAFTDDAGFSPLGPIGGAGFFDADAEFTFAAFQTEGGQAGAFLAGTPTGALAAGGDRGLRLYDVSDDLLTGGAAFLPGSGLAAADPAFSSGADGLGELILISTADGAAAGPGAAALATFLSIEGEGAAQQSGFGVLTADVEASGNGGPAFSGGFEGVFSNGDDEGGARVATPVATLEDGAGGAAFGPDAAFFALTNNRDLTTDAPAFGRVFDGAGGDAGFGTNSVAALSGAETLGPAPDAVFTGGFAAAVGLDLGTGARFVARSGDQGAVGTLNGGVVDLSLSLTDSFATGDGAADEPALASLTVLFGGAGRGAALDADRFAARGASPGGASANGEAIAQTTDDAGAAGFHGALATAALAGTGGIFPADVAAAPAHLTWGWWAGDLRSDPAGAALDDDQRLHLSAWIAGDVTASADLPLDGSATYEGFAALSVIDNGVSFVDGAGVTLDYDFGDRLGTMTFSDLLGQNPTVAVTDNVFDAQFGGTAGMALNGRDGLINVEGSFFNAGGVAAGAAAGSLAVQSLDNTIAGAGVFGADRVTP